MLLDIPILFMISLRDKFSLTSILLRITASLLNMLVNVIAFSSVSDDEMLADINGKMNSLSFFAMQ